MSSSRKAFEADACPVGDDLLGNLYRASEHGLPALVESVAPDVRAMLALFCYRRNHLHAMGLAIAATCTERDLFEQGGFAGGTLFKLSRQEPSTVAPPSPYGRRAITLSSKPLREIVSFDEDIEDEMAAIPA